jgi:hypothetical protein
MLLPELIDAVMSASSAYGQRLSLKTRTTNNESTYVRIFLWLALIMMIPSSKGKQFTTMVKFIMPLKHGMYQCHQNADVTISTAKE